MALPHYFLFCLLFTHLSYSHYLYNKDVQTLNAWMRKTFHLPDEEYDTHNAFEYLHRPYHYHTYDRTPPLINTELTHGSHITYEHSLVEASQRPNILISLHHKLDQIKEDYQQKISNLSNIFKQIVSKHSKLNETLDNKFLEDNFLRKRIKNKIATIQKHFEDHPLLNYLNKIRDNVKNQSNAFIDSAIHTNLKNISVLFNKNVSWSDKNDYIHEALSLNDVVTKLNDTKAESNIEITTQALPQTMINENLEILSNFAYHPVNVHQETPSILSDVISKIRNISQKIHNLKHKSSNDYEVNYNYSLIHEPILRHDEGISEFKSLNDSDDYDKYDFINTSPIESNFSLHDVIEHNIIPNATIDFDSSNGFTKNVNDTYKADLIIDKEPIIDENNNFNDTKEIRARTEDDTIESSNIQSKKPIIDDSFDLLFDGTLVTPVQNMEKSSYKDATPLPELKTEIVVENNVNTERIMVNEIVSKTIHDKDLENRNQIYHTDSNVDDDLSKVDPTPIFKDQYPTILIVPTQTAVIFDNIIESKIEDQNISIENTTPREMSPKFDADGVNVPEIKVTSDTQKNDDLFQIPGLFADTNKPLDSSNFVLGEELSKDNVDASSIPELNEIESQGNTDYADSENIPNVDDLLSLFNVLNNVSYNANSPISSEVTTKEYTDFRKISEFEDVLSKETNAINASAESKVNQFKVDNEEVDEKSSGDSVEGRESGVEDIGKKDAVKVLFDKSIPILNATSDGSPIVRSDEGNSGRESRKFYKNHVINSHYEDNNLDQSMTMEDEGFIRYAKPEQANRSDISVDEEEDDYLWSELGSGQEYYAQEI